MGSVVELVGSIARAPWLGCTGLVALQRVESSQSRNQTCVPSIDRWILSVESCPKATGEAFDTKVIEAESRTKVNSKAD